MSMKGSEQTSLCPAFIQPPLIVRTLIAHQHAATRLHLTAAINTAAHREHTSGRSEVSLRTF